VRRFGRSSSPEAATRADRSQLWNPEGGEQVLKHLTKLYVTIQSYLIDIPRREEGATAAEYALLIALIAVAIIAGARFLGSAINTRLSDVGTTITTA
jgi:pilus assembly protein Flp/PilA